MYDPTDPIEADSDLRHLTQLLSTLVRVPSVTGSESPFMRSLERELVMHGAEVREFQGVLEARGSDPDSLIISAHVDRHGIVCTGPDEYQYAAYVTKAQGDLDENTISDQMVATISERFRGEVLESYDPWHGGYMGQSVVQHVEYCPRRGNLVFELDDHRRVRAGTPFAYLQPLVVGEDSLSGQLDNVLGVALVVDMFRRGFKGTALFTAEEEAGRSWRYLLNWFRRRDADSRRLLVVDTSPYPDDETARAQDIVLRNKDAFGAFAPEMVGELRSICDSSGIRASFKDEQIEELNEQREQRSEPTKSLGRTELGRMVIATDGAITGATLQLPTTGYHTPEETVAVASLVAGLRVTDALIKRCAES